MLIRPHRNLVSSRLNSTGSLILSSHVRCPRSFIIFVALHWTYSSMNISRVLGSPGLNPALQICLWWVGGRIISHEWLLLLLFLMQPTMLLVLLQRQLVHQDHWVFCQPTFQLVKILFRFESKILTKSNVFRNKCIWNKNWNYGNLPELIYLKEPNKRYVL